MVVLAACSDSDEELTPVTVMLDWTPNTNHMGIFVANEQGWYEDAGLDVTIIEPTGGVEAIVAEGQAQFGISYAEAVLPARLAGVGVTSVATILPHNESSLMSLASDGIARPRDLEGNKYGGFGGQLEQQLIESLVACDGGDPSLVEFVEVDNIDYIPGGMDQDRFDFVWVFEGWDVIRARNLEGVEITTLPFIDYTECIPDWYTPVIVAGDDLIAVDPDLVRTFLEVTARGYDFIADKPDEAATLLLGAAPELDEQLVRDSAAYLAGRFTDGAGWGQQQDSIWLEFEVFLREAELIEAEVDVAEAYTNEFLPS